MAADGRDSGSFSFTALPIALGLAFAFLVGQAVLFFAGGLGLQALIAAFGHRGTLEDVAGVFLGLVVVWAHALFVLMVADATRPRPGHRLSSLLRASVPLSVAFVAFAFLDGAGSSYGCAEGHAFRHTAAPMLPWIWIGWLTLTLFAIPTRLLAWSRNVRLDVMPIWRRALLLPLGAAPVWLLGYVFQNHTIDCTTPQEGWGLFEGGVVTIPLYGAFLFATCTSMAMLTAAFTVPKGKPQEP